MELWLLMSLSLPIVFLLLHRVRREPRVLHLHLPPQEPQVLHPHHRLHFSHQKAQLPLFLCPRLFRDLLHLHPQSHLQYLPLHLPFLRPQREAPHLPLLCRGLLRERRHPHHRHLRLVSLPLLQGRLLFQELQRGHRALLKSPKALQELQRDHRRHLLPRLPLLYLQLPQEPRVFLLPILLLFQGRLPILLQVLRQSR